jgi:hypothetical protein
MIVFRIIGLWLRLLEAKLRDELRNCNACGGR